MATKQLGRFRLAMAAAAAVIGLTPKPPSARKRFEPALKPVPQPRPTESPEVLRGRAVGRALAEVRHVSKYGGYPVGEKPKRQEPPTPALSPRERFHRLAAAFLVRRRSYRSALV